MQKYWKIHSHVTYRQHKKAVWPQGTVTIAIFLLQSHYVILNFGKTNFHAAGLLLGGLVTPLELLFPFITLCAVVWQT